MSPEWRYIARSPGFLIPGLWPKGGTLLPALVLGVWPTALHFLYIQEAPRSCFSPRCYSYPKHTTSETELGSLGTPVLVELPAAGRVSDLL